MTGPLDSAFVKAAALRAGFHEAGIAEAVGLPAGPIDHVLEQGWQADMAWLRTQRAERLDPARLLPGARSVLALALSYRAGWGAESGSRSGSGVGATGQVAAGEAGQVARYARGRDYHTVIKKKLKVLVAELTARDPGVRCFPSADVAPVMEKVWAERAGLGWIGKNGCLITPRHGSWVLLATVIIDRALEPDAPHPERCGTCQACLPACPVGAIPEPGYVDARRCLSFWTIERRGPIDEAVAGALGGWAFGCDDCQTSCPWNGASHGPGPPTADPELLPREGQSALSIEGLLTLTKGEYARRFHGTALARARFDGLVRNAALLAGASGDRRWVARLEPLRQSPHEGVRAAAAWALRRLGGG